MTNILKIDHANSSISEQFFGWILGFGDKIQIVSPQSVVDEFKEYLDRVRKLY